MPEDKETTPGTQPAGGAPDAPGAGPGTGEAEKAAGGDAEKKGLSPLAWVGIGCGTLVVLFFAGCVVAGYMGMAWLGGIVGEFEDNPAMASAKMIVRTNPELELVSSDDEAGTLTIRNRETGETVTVDLQQIEEGRIRFESADEEITLGVESGEEGEGGFTVEDKEGETRFRVGAGGDADIPDWVPRYPDVQPSGTSLMRSGDELNGGFTLETEDSVEDVIAHYREALEEAGFTESSYTTSQSGDRRNANLVAESGDRQVGIMASSDADTTQVVVTFSEGS